MGFVLMTFQRGQVYTQPARTAEEANRRNALVVTSGSIWVGTDEIGWIENGNVFSVATKLKFATLDDNGDLYSVDGESLNLHLETVNGGGRIAAGSHPHAIARFRKLAFESES
jgi:hypothetical protein